jgi:ubiquinone/menaquinone biosynthesis C-methylase UbiE
MLAPMGGPGFDPDIDRYYSAEWDEDARLRSGLREIELVRTRELIGRHLRDGENRVLDVGGGTGVHAEWLLNDGHTVVLVDPVQRHVAQASDQLGHHDRFVCLSGDARRLDFGDDVFDAVLLLGPLYHLIDADDRSDAWSEARRVAKPGGVVCAAAITRFASLFAGLEEDEAYVEEFRTIIEQDLATGQHRNPPGSDYFTTAYFHHPDDLASEAVAAGLVDVEVYAVEGPVGAMPQLERHWNSVSRRNVILDLVRFVEQEPTLIGIGPHILAFGRKPDN